MLMVYTTNQHGEFKGMLLIILLLPHYNALHTITSHMSLPITSLTHHFPNLSHLSESLWGPTALWSPSGSNHRSRPPPAAAPRSRAQPCSRNARRSCQGQGWSLTSTWRWKNDEKNDGNLQMNTEIPWKWMNIVHFQWENPLKTSGKLTIMRSSTLKIVHIVSGK